MEWNQIQQYVIPAILIGFIAWRMVKFRVVKRKVPALLRNGAIIVDVRSRGEFAGAANPSSINIPLDELERGLGELDHAKPIVLCCASGSRSAMAAAILRRKGFRQVINAGPRRNTVQE